MTQSPTDSDPLAPLLPRLDEQRLGAIAERLTHDHRHLPRPRQDALRSLINTTGGIPGYRDPLRAPASILLAKLKQIGSRPRHAMPLLRLWLQAVDREIERVKHCLTAQEVFGSAPCSREPALDARDTGLARPELELALIYLGVDPNQRGTAENGHLGAPACDVDGHALGVESPNNGTDGDPLSKSVTEDDGLPSNGSSSSEAGVKGPPDVTSPLFQRWRAELESLPATAEEWAQLPAFIRYIAEGKLKPYRVGGE